MDEHGVTFRWKDYRAKGKTRHKTMTLGAEEFMRRFLLHVLPGGFHRIRHYGLLANGSRKANLARARELLHAVPAATRKLRTADAEIEHAKPCFVCPHCGAAMLILQTFARGADDPRATPTAARTMSAIVCHVPTTRRLFIAQSRHGMTSPCAHSRGPLLEISSTSTPTAAADARRYTSAADRCARPIAAVIASATAQFAIAP